MAYILVDPSGKSNAKVGDMVVTGGGIFEKLADGSSRLVEKLSTPTGKTKSYSEVVSEFNRLVNKSSKQESAPVEESYKVQSVDDNGVVNLATPGYDPADYTTVSKASGSTSLSNVLGYIVLGLVGIALLDRFMNGKAG